MSNPLYRTRTPYDDRIYSEEWHLWRDPEVPEWLDPVGWLLDHHLDTPIVTKTAIVCNDECVTYLELSDRVAAYAGALAGLGLGPESRLLLFGTDNISFSS